MAIKIYKKDTQKQDIFLELRQEGGVIKLVAVDGVGRWIKDILCIKANGTLHRYTSAKAPGLQTDPDGRITLEED